MRKHVSENSLHAKACMSVQGTCLLSCFVRGQEWSVQQSPQWNRRATEYLTPALPTTRVLEVLLKTYLSPKLKPLVFAMNNHNLTWFTLLGLLTLLRIRTASSLVEMCYLIRSAGDGSTPSPTSVACRGWGETCPHHRQLSSPCRCNKILSASIIFFPTHSSHRAAASLLSPFDCHPLKLTTAALLHPQSSLQVLKYCHASAQRRHCRTLAPLLWILLLCLALYDPNGAR